jgi:hypothetical protein
MTPTNALDPREYPYDPQWQIIALNFGAGLGWLGLVRILNGRLNLFSVILGLVPVTLAFLLVIRRLAFKRHLVLDTDAILLPTGFLRVRAVRIPYNDIKRIWRTRLIWIDVICLGTTRGKFEILPTLLPESGSLMAIEQFLNSRVPRNQN